MRRHVVSAWDVLKQEVHPMPHRNGTNETESVKQLGSMNTEDSKKNNEMGGNTEQATGTGDEKETGPTAALLHISQVAFRVGKGACSLR